MKSVPVVLAALLLISPVTAAQGAGASQKLKHAVAAALKDYKAASKDALELLSLQLQILEKDVEINNWSGDAQEDLLGAIDGFQDGMYLALTVARSAIATEGAAALDNFAGEGNLNGQFPAGFSHGDGGPLDDFVAKRAKLDAKQYAKVAARLAKTAKVLEQSGNQLLNVVLRPIHPAPPYAFSEGSSTELFTAPEIDTLVGLGPSDETAGALIFAGGTRFGESAVRVMFTDATSRDSTDVLVADDDSDRWEIVHTGGDGLQDGHWFVGVRDDGDQVSDSLAIGLR